MQISMYVCMRRLRHECLFEHMGEKIHVCRVCVCVCVCVSVCVRACLRVARACRVVSIERLLERVRVCVCMFERRREESESEKDRG